MNYREQYELLAQAVKDLCLAAYWKADRPVEGGEKAPWRAVRKLAGIPDDVMPTNYKQSPNYEPDLPPGVPDPATPPTSKGFPPWT